MYYLYNNSKFLNNKKENKEEKKRKEKKERKRKKERKKEKKEGRSKEKEAKNKGINSLPLESVQTRQWTGYRPGGLVDMRSKDFKLLLIVYCVKFFLSIDDAGLEPATSATCTVRFS